MQPESYSLLEFWKKKTHGNSFVESVMANFTVGSWNSNEFWTWPPPIEFIRAWHLKAAKVSKAWVKASAVAHAHAYV